MVTNLANASVNDTETREWESFVLCLGQQNHLELQEEHLHCSNRKLVIEVQQKAEWVCEGQGMGRRKKNRSLCNRPSAILLRFTALAISCRRIP